MMPRNLIRLNYAANRIQAYCDWADLVARAKELGIEPEMERTAEDSVGAIDKAIDWLRTDILKSFPEFQWTPPSAR